MKNKQEKLEHESLLVGNGSEGAGRWARLAAKGLRVGAWTRAGGTENKGFLLAETGL